MIVGKNLAILLATLTKMTNVWEQERFENIYQKYSVKNNFRLDFNKYISIATNTYKNDFTNISKDTLGNYILFKKGYVAFEGHTNIQFPFGRFVMNTIGDGIVSNIFSVFKPVFAQDLYYWKYAINNNKVMLEALKKSSKSGIMMNTLDIEVLNQQIILFPNQKEQNLIGLLFVLLDSLIALHQRELKILKIFKKSLFVKMIVGKNLTILSATLMKMTNVWEQERLGNLLNYIRPDNFYTRYDEIPESGKNPVLTANKSFILGYSNETNTFDKECIIFDDFTQDFKYVNFPFLVKSSAIKILINKNTMFDVYSLFLIMLSVKLENFGHARHYINFVQNKNIILCGFHEMKRIRAIFKHLNSLITLHQREDSQSLNQGCLVILIVNIGKLHLCILVFYLLS
ncbi:hypothetical protein RRG46_03060 [Mycoplasmopsis cynos]|uniref:Uncharacterized protein n=2 Tax=Mycoplasmopsis cynos TaxID=171284 RepID=A0ABD8AIE0_9BACT|nr:hypothetical protein [Mycoplasmopsis cynos]WQQ19803.1 hypothetical protein RRG46_03060 [Mycoplasmopsis cynos]